MSALISSQKKEEIQALIHAYLETHCDSTVSVFAENTGLSLATAQRIARGRNFPSHRNLQILKTVIPEIGDIQKRVDKPPRKELSSRETTTENGGDMALAENILELVTENIRGVNDRIKAQDERLATITLMVNEVLKGLQDRINTLEKEK